MPNGWLTMLGPSIIPMRPWLQLAQTRYGLLIYVDTKFLKQGVFRGDGTLHVTHLDLIMILGL